MDTFVGQLIVMMLIVGVSAPIFVVMSVWQYREDKKRKYYDKLYSDIFNKGK